MALIMFWSELITINSPFSFQEWTICEEKPKDDLNLMLPCRNVQNPAICLLNVSAENFNASCKEKEGKEEEKTGNTYWCQGNNYGMESDWLCHCINSQSFTWQTCMVVRPTKKQTLDNLGILRAA
eukprot:bmy_08045T0